jgi:hypothetical protein
MTKIDSGTDFIVTLVKGTEQKELTIRSSTADGAADYAKLVVEHQPQDYAGFLIYSVRKATMNDFMNADLSAKTADEIMKVVVAGGIFSNAGQKDIRRNIVDILDHNVKEWVQP